MSCHLVPDSRFARAGRGARRKQAFFFTLRRRARLTSCALVLGVALGAAPLADIEKDPALLALAAIPAGQINHAQARGADPGMGQTGSGFRILARDRALLAFSLAVFLFHLANAAMLPLIAAEITARSGDFANMIIAACIVLPQAVVALCSPWVGRRAELSGRRTMLLLGWAALPLRGVLLALLPGAWLPIAAQAVGGISAAVFGVLFPLIAADITRGTSHFNLCMGALGLAVSFGAALSTTLGGWIADTAGVPVAFAVLSLVGLFATLAVWLAMPETRSD